MAFARPPGFRTQIGYHRLVSGHIDGPFPHPMRDRRGNGPILRIFCHIRTGKRVLLLRSRVRHGNGIVLRIVFQCYMPYQRIDSQQLEVTAVFHLLAE